MAHAELLNRITSDPSIFGGKPIVCGKRLAVEHIVSMLAAGDTTQDLIVAYPFLEPADVAASVSYVNQRGLKHPSSSHRDG